jgi:hypothetical protein
MGIRGPSALPAACFHQRNLTKCASLPRKRQAAAARAANRNQYSISPVDSTAAIGSPHSEYSGRTAAQRLAQSEFQKRHSRFGMANLAAAVAFVILLVWALTYRTISVAWIFAPFLTFILLNVFHSRVLASLQESARVIAFYERGLARLEDGWVGGGEAGDAFLDLAHPYARDLDIFGKGSLYELLCTARTNSGQKILAEWLLRPAGLDEIHARHAAVAELRLRLDLREALAISGEEIRSTLHPDSMTAWAESKPPLQPTGWRIAAFLLAALWLFSLAAWAAWGLWPVALAVSLLNSICNAQFKQRLTGRAPAPGMAPELGLLAAVIGRLEHESFSAPKLVGLQTSLGAAGHPPSILMRKLKRLIESLESRRNLFLVAVDRFILWNVQFSLAIDAWRHKYGHAMRGWLASVGEAEALCALANYAYEHPSCVFPEFTPGGEALFNATGLAHPLLPESRAVRNDVRLGGEMRVMIVSGPNMAGKSTFVRAIGINAVLAQCGAPVCAHRLRMSRLAVAASICVLDSLQGGVSRFYAEITRLKLIVEMTKGALPVLFLLDELLSGTNSHDRHAGAEAIVRSLVARSAIGMITTHDLALTQMAEDLNLKAENFHFQDSLENNKLSFDYRLYPGIVQTSNALKLMRSIGLEV